MTETVTEIVRANRAGAKPEDAVARTYERIRKYGDPAVFISLRDEAEALAEAKELAHKNASGMPLFGVPVAVKDNIDVRGLPTTAACPAYSYQPTKDATVVARLRQAGAIVIGKTNLDQFATGLVGVRSPYGVPRNPFDPKLIPGGSSSGSAVAVSSGIVPLSLGTDTAGSGRVPAGLNNLVGLKPSLGLVSTVGVVPACRSLDCVSIFALTVDDAYLALSVAAGHDAEDAFSRRMMVAPLGPMPPELRIAVPKPDQRHFFGDARSEKSFESAVALMRDLKITISEIDFEPFLETARLLYEGPWVAERYAAVGEFIGAHPGDIHPVTRDIILSGEKRSATDAFRALYRLAELRAQCIAAMSGIDALMVPTAPAAYSVEQLNADPIRLNSNLGTYTNFVNLLDLSGLAVPISFSDDGVPFGITLLARAGADGFLASIGRVVHARTGLPLGASGKAQPPLTEVSGDASQDEIAVAVVGAHLSGMPLNGELRELGGRFLQATATAPDYRLFALADTQPAKPGMLRVLPGEGVAIDIEIWALPPSGFGRFVAGIPAPLSIGTIALSDGRHVKGFLVEAAGTSGARDISAFGGWRNFVAQGAK